MSQQKEQLERILTQDIGLTPYESKAYVAIVLYGPMTPSELNQKAGIPRPRTYDVLNSLVGKGLLVEQPGRPPLYASMEPKQGLKNLLVEIERDTLTLLDEKRKIIYNIAESLSAQYEKKSKQPSEKDPVWVTRRNTALVAKYAEAIRNIEKELIVLSNDARIAEKEILDAVREVLKEKKTVRVVRRITELWSLKDITAYEKILKLGSQVRYLDKIPIRYSILDRKTIVFWLPERGFPRAEIMTVWVTSPSLAEILHEHFERIWALSQPVMPMLENFKEKLKK